MVPRQSIVKKTITKAITGDDDAVAMMVLDDSCNYMSYRCKLFVCKQVLSGITLFPIETCADMLRVQHSSTCTYYTFVPPPASSDIPVLCNSPTTVSSFKHSYRPCCQLTCCVAVVVKQAGTRTVRRKKTVPR